MHSIVTRSPLISAQIFFTRAFRTAGNWQSACKLIGLDYGGPELAVESMRLAKSVASMTINRNVSTRRVRANRPKWKFKR